MTAQRIQRKRTKGWRMPADAVYVGRPTIWGNPFVHPDPAQAVAAFRRYLRGGTQSFEMGPGGLQFAKDAHPNATHWAYADFVREHIHQLQGKTLACWCPEGQPCHADVLLELANAPDAAR
jgi:hypothetical protein